MSHGVTIRVSVAVAMILVLAGCAANRGASPPPSPTSTRPLVRGQNLESLLDPSGLGQALSTIEKLDAAANKSSYDVAAKAMELGGDVGAIFAFVRDQVRFEVYEGVLRGPNGTLMAMAGNAFDKSLLLASLLSRHGYTVRYVRGRLPQDAASRLVSQMYAGADNLADSRPVGIPPDARTEAAAAEFTSLVIARWFNHLDVIRTALDAAKVKLILDRPAQELLIEEAANHLWVEVERNGEWVALDPSFRDAQPGQALGAVEATLDDIPNEAFQTISIRVMVEERAGETPASRPLLSHTATAAALNGAFVVFAHEISGALGSWSARPMLRVDDQTILGSDVGLGRSTGQQLGERVGGLLGRRPGQAGEPSAEWLEFEFGLPSGRKEVVRRDIFDRIGLARRTAGALEGDLPPLPAADGIPLALQGTYAFSFASGRLHPSVLLNDIAAQLPRLRQVEPLLVNALRTGGQVSEKEQKALAELLSPIIPLILSQGARAFHIHSQRGLLMVREALRPGTIWLYEAAPRLAIASIEATTDKAGKVKAVTTIDLRRNTLRVAGPDLSPARAASANLLRGVLDGVLEHTLLEQSASSRPRVPLASTVAVVEAASSSGIPRRAVSSAQDVRALAVSDDVKARMTLAAQTAVLVAPARTVGINGEERLGWWQVDVRSGETLAVMDSGLHQTGTERPGLEPIAVPLTLGLVLEWLAVVASGLSTLAFLMWLSYQIGFQQGQQQGGREMVDRYSEHERQRRRADCAYQPASCEQTRENR